MKRCSKCGEEFPATNQFFALAKRNKDGLKSQCKVCKSKQDKAYMKYKSVNMLIKQFITVAQRYKSTNELEIKPIVVAQRYRGNGLFMLTTAALVKKPSQELIPLKIFRSSMIDKEVHVIGAIRS